MSVTILTLEDLDKQVHYIDQKHWADLPKDLKFWVVDVLNQCLVTTFGEATEFARKECLRQAKGDAKRFARYDTLIFGFLLTFHPDSHTRAENIMRPKLARDRDKGQRT